MKQHRLLIATDVPFWRKSTGAEQRISSLVRFLISESFVIRTFYLGQTGTDQFTESDQQLISQNSLDVQQRSSDHPPKGLTDKIGWYAAATLNQIRSLTRSKSDEGPVNEALEALTLADFRWPWAATAFAEAVNEFQPDSVLIEYVKLGYLLDALSPKHRSSIYCLVDTHDVLHLRCEQFRQHGFSHWIEINREEESQELAKFDLVLAIQSEEAKIFEEMAPAARTIICGHATELPNRASEISIKSSPQGANHPALRVGYLASSNWSNAQAIDAFLTNVWAPLMDDEDSHRFELIVGGSICEFVESKIKTLPSEKQLNVRLLGRVDELSTFYDSIDLVINPVEFGTGLKIKTVESLAFGVPVLTTPVGTAGLPEALQSSASGENNCPVFVCDSSKKFEQHLKILANSPARLQECSEAAKQLSQTAFSAQRAYSELKQCLDNSR